MTSHEALESPFGGPARYLSSLPTAELAVRYRDKCGAEIAWAFHDVQSISLFECEATGYQFWRPAEVAGDERFYQTLAAHWKTYYRESRWEYGPASQQCEQSARVLEVGCGRGYFLRQIEQHVASAEGVELNTEAAASKVTRAEVHTRPLAELAATRAQAFDVVCSFQVLEHIVEPRRFILDCSALLKPGGRLVLSTPNHACASNRDFSDPFNLPPHHMGHFSADTYARLAPQVGLRFERCFIQPSRSPSSNPLVRLASNIWRSLTREPGPNLLVVLRKE